MSYNKVMLGKIINIDYKTNTGEILTSDEKYLFIIEEKTNFKEGDLVKFRAEKVQDTNKAYFVSKIDSKESIKFNILNSKTYYYDD